MPYGVINPFSSMPTSLGQLLTAVGAQSNEARLAATARSGQAFRESLGNIAARNAQAAESRAKMQATRQQQTLQSAQNMIATFLSLGERRAQEQQATAARALAERLASMRETGETGRATAELDVRERLARMRETGESERLQQDIEARKALAATKGDEGRAVFASPTEKQKADYAAVWGISLEEAGKHLSAGTTPKSELEKQAQVVLQPWIDSFGPDKDGTPPSAEYLKNLMPGAIQAFDAVEKRAADAGNQALLEETQSQRQLLGIPARMTAAPSAPAAVPAQGSNWLGQSLMPTTTADSNAPIGERWLSQLLMPETTRLGLQYLRDRSWPGLGSPPFVPGRTLTGPTLPLRTLPPGQMLSPTSQPFRSR